MTITDDYMFKLVMRHPKICKRLIEKILKIKVKHIDYLDDEKSLKFRYSGKGVRLDVYVEGDDTIYDIDYSEFPVIPSFTSTYLSLLALDVKHRNNISAIA